MDVRAIIVVGHVDPSQEVQGSAPESFAALPLALSEVLGKSILSRTVQRLRHYGVMNVVTVCEADAISALDADTIRDCNVIAPDRGLWKTAERAFNEFVQKGAELVLVVRLGPYSELDYEEFLQYHLTHPGSATVAVDARGYRIGIVALNPSRRNDASYLFRHNMEEFRVPCQQYVFRGYMNRLITPMDLRQLAVDALLQHNHVQPVGKQVKPGVWVGPSARIHPRARIVAPAYIGERAKVRAAAVITRFTSIEHHAIVDCGTVVENTTVAPFTYVGAGLDVNYAIVGGGRIASLRRNVEVEIKDPKLVSSISSSAPLRAVREMGALATYLPQQIFRGFFAKSRRSAPSDVPTAVNSPSAAIKEPAITNPDGSMNSTEFPSDFAVARRYGNE